MWRWVLHWEWGWKVSNTRLAKQIGIGIIVLGFIILLVATNNTGNDIPTAVPGGAVQREAAEPTITPEVSVITVEAGSHQSLVVAYGVATPTYQVDLQAEVNGRVMQVAEEFVTGEVLSKGTTLLTIDPTDYELALSQAEQTLAQSELNLLEEQRQVSQVEVEWRRSGVDGEPDPLVLRKPYLEVAKKSFDVATASLKRAQRDLENTQVRTPFGAAIVQRLVSPGDYVRVGSQLATLYSTDQIEVRVSLAEEYWRQLKGGQGFDSADFSVTLKDVESARVWSGRAAREEKHLDDETRERSLIIVVENPHKQDVPLFPGTFLEVQIEGRQVSGLWELPETALTLNGDIWLVDDSNELRRLKASVAFRRDEKIYVHAPAGLGPTRVAVRPLGSYLSGTVVIPMGGNS